MLKDLSTLRNERQPIMEVLETYPRLLSITKRRLLLAVDRHMRHCFCELEEHKGQLAGSVQTRICITPDAVLIIESLPDGMKMFAWLE